MKGKVVPARKKGKSTTHSPTLSIHPHPRVTVEEALSHEFLTPVRQAARELCADSPLTMDIEAEGVELNKETLKKR